MPLLLDCPSCQRKLRVPDNLLGQTVKCPTCGETFTIARTESPPEGAEAAAPGEPARQPVPSAPRPQEPDWAAQDRIQSAVRAPAIALLVVGVMGMFGTGLNLVNVTVNEAQFKEQFRQMFRIMLPQENEAPPVEEFVVISKVLYASFAALSLIVVIGAIQMMRLRSYWLAVAASIMVMFNLICGCCVVGLPVGIWALIVLFRPGTSGVFQS